MFESGEVGDRGPERDIHIEREREKYPQIQVSCEASAGVKGYTCWCPGASLCRLSVSLFLSSWTCRSLSTPPPSLHLPDPGQFCPAMHGHLWEFIPDASCSLHPLFFPSLFSICHTNHPNPQPPTHPALHLHVFTICPVNHVYFLSIFSC